MTGWFARPVLHVKDVDASLRFYVDRLGFTSPWPGAPLFAHFAKGGYGAANSDVLADC